MKRFRWVKVVSFMAIAFGLLVVGELGQAIAESFLAKQEKEMTALVNAHRERHDKKTLPTSPGLRMLARRQAQRMVAAGYIYHNPDLEKEADDAVPGWMAIGENVGVGPDTVSVFRAFIDSEPHHFNIDYRDYNIVAIGAMAGQNGRVFFTQNFAKHSSAKKLRKAERKAERREARRQARREERAEAEAEASPSPEPQEQPQQQPEQQQAQQEGGLLSEVLGCHFTQEGERVPCPGPGAPPVPAETPDEGGVGLFSALGGMLSRAASNIGRGLGALAFWR